MREISKMSKREFIKYIKNDEIGLFIMTIENEEIFLKAEEVLEKAKDIKVSEINRIKGIITGSMLGKKMELSLI